MDFYYLTKTVLGSALEGTEKFFGVPFPLPPLRQDQDYRNGQVVEETRISLPRKGGRPTG